MIYAVCMSSPTKVFILSTYRKKEIYKFTNCVNL